MRLIDADALGIGLCNPDVIMDRAYAAGWNGVVRLLQSAPTITPESLVRHGRWIDVYYYGAEQSKAMGTCSYCKKRGELRTRGNDYCLWYIDMPFCPDCGAKMDLKE